MKKIKHVISKVDPGSIAEELELEPGDTLLKMNGTEIEDIFDYQFLVHDEYIVLEVQKADGEIWELEVEKDEDEDLGLNFENGLMDDYRSCCNKCVFCFIDQMPPGMRPTLYFKDDDSRLSFLQGNYVTLTNMTDADIDRLIRYRMEPINVSVHVTDPAIRVKMLNNRFAGEALKKLDRLYEAGIQMNGQIVLCPGLNDGAVLERSLSDLFRYAPVMASVSVVPVGMTKYRDGLYPLKPVDQTCAGETIDIIEGWQAQAFEKFGTHWVHASDEFYLLAKRELPDEERYDGYPQLENGVGMLRLQQVECDAALDAFALEDEVKGTVTIATGLLAAPSLERIAQKAGRRFPGSRAKVVPIINHFFGEAITVSGLITGSDLIGQLKGQELGDYLLIPTNMLRSGETVFLDDVTLKDVEEALGIRILVVKSDGQSLIDAILKKKGADLTGQLHSPYEQ